MRTTLFVAVCVAVWSFAITALPVSAQSVGAITGLAKVIAQLGECGLWHSRGDTRTLSTNHSRAMH